MGKLDTGIYSAFAEMHLTADDLQMLWHEGVISLLTNVANKCGEFSWLFT